MNERIQASTYNFIELPMRRIAGLLLLVFFTCLFFQCMPVHAASCSTDCILPIQYSAHTSYAAVITPYISLQASSDFVTPLADAPVVFIRFTFNHVNNKSPPSAYAFVL